MKHLAALAPYLLLCVGVLALLLSTRQWRTPVRLAIWAIGVCGVLGAILQRPNEAGAGLNLMLADFGKNLATPGQSLLAQVLTDNWITVQNVAPPMFDVATTIAIVLALVALLALSPGERMERLLRPLLIGLLGAGVGALAALVLVASGLAGYQKDRVYVGVLTDEDVYDGDTLKMGDVSIRLNGVDAPEKQQNCIGAPDCAEQARTILSELVKDALVVCVPPPASKPRTPPKESFGRPILDCTARRDGQMPFDLSAKVVEIGAAVPFRNASGALRSAFADGQFQLGCMLKPHIWRNNKDARDRFSAGIYAAEDVTGACPTPR